LNPGLSLQSSRKNFGKFFPTQGGQTPIGNIKIVGQQHPSPIEISHITSLSI
jgi:hypothetical protein